MRKTESGGGKPDKIIRDALIAAHRQSPHKLKNGAEALLDKLELGDDAAWKFFAERVDGKVAQPISGDSESPIEIIQRIERHIVDVK